MDHNISPGDRAQCEAAWAANRELIRAMLDGLRPMIEMDMGDDGRDPAIVSAALIGMMTREAQQDPGFLFKLPTMVAVLLTDALFGNEGLIAVDDMPPVVTTVEAQNAVTDEIMAGLAVRTEVNRRYVVRLARIGEVSAGAMRSIERAFADLGIDLPPFEYDD